MVVVSVGVVVAAVVGVVVGIVVAAVVGVVVGIVVAAVVGIVQKHHAPVSSKAKDLQDSTHATTRCIRSVMVCSASNLRWSSAA